MPAIDRKFVVTVSVWTDAPTTRKAVKEWVQEALDEGDWLGGDKFAIVRASARKVDKE